MKFYKRIIFILIILTFLNGCNANIKKNGNKIKGVPLELPSEDNKTEPQNFSELNNKYNSNENSICEKKISGPIEVLQIEDLNVPIIDVTSNGKDLYLLSEFSPEDNKGFLYKYDIQESNFVTKSDVIDKPSSIVSLEEDRIIVRLHRTHRVYSADDLSIIFPGFGDLNSIFIKTIQNKSYFWSTEYFIPDQLCCEDLLSGNVKWIFKKENFYFSENLTAINNLTWFFGIDKNGKVYSFLINSETGNKIDEKYLFDALKPDSYGMDVYPCILNCEFKGNKAYLGTRTSEGIVIYCYELKNDNTIIQQWKILFKGKPRLNEIWEGLALDFKIIVDEARVYLCISELNKGKENNIIRTEKVYVLNSLTGEELWHHDFNPSDGRIRNIYVPAENDLNDIFFIVSSLSNSSLSSFSSTNILCVNRDNGNTIWRREFDFDINTMYLNSTLLPLINANNCWLFIVSKKSEYYPQLVIVNAKNGDCIATFEPGNTAKRVENWKSLGYSGENRNYLLFTSFNDELIFCTYDGRIFHLKLIEK